MSRDNVDYGPLLGLIGFWEGHSGEDVAPEEDGAENNLYTETLEITPSGDVTNAERQTLVALHYRQIVKRKSTGKVFHDQTGYWIWDEERNCVMNSFSIPRGVNVLAGGTVDVSHSKDVSIRVSAAAESESWSISETSFMHDNAKTLSFSMDLDLSGDTLSYSQVTQLYIYGKEFQHTDKNVLSRVAYK